MASRNSRTVLTVSIVATVSVVVIGVVLGVFFLTRSADRTAQAARFQGNIQQYLAINNEPTEQEAYIKGKILVINKKDKTVDDELFFRLPAADRAGSPEEVGTVILVSWGKELAGFYSNKRGDGGGGYVHKCEVTIIDKSISTVIYRRWFNGSLPPLKSSGSGDRYGSRPVQEIVDYLTALPREKSVEAPPPADWMVLFRSDDPSVWNTDSPGDKFAIPMRRVPRGIRFLRLKRMELLVLGVGGLALFGYRGRHHGSRQDHVAPPRRVRSRHQHDHVGAVELPVDTGHVPGRDAVQRRLRLHAAAAGQQHSPELDRRARHPIPCR